MPEDWGESGVYPAEKKLAEYGWHSKRSVKDWLFAEPWEFEFFQAIKILELLDPDRAAPGEHADPDREVVRLHSRVTLEYSASELQQFLPPDQPGHPPHLVVNLMGLAGVNGPLPDPDTERVLDSAWRKDTAIRDFLDMFNHRLLSLLVLIRKAHHPSLTSVTPDRGRMAHYLFSLFGMAPDEVRGRLRIPDRSLLFYSGILARHPRSASGLERMFTDYFQVPTRVRQLVGVWRSLEPGQWSRIGIMGQNQSLGRDAILGTRVWDQQGRFELNIGPMNLSKFTDFLPCGSAYPALCELTRFYAGQNFEFDIKLTIRAEEVPRSRVGGNCRLGWTSWLVTRTPERDDSQVRLRGRLPESGEAAA
jgi:type VI secretion system protein ImpH